MLHVWLDAYIKARIEIKPRRFATRTAEPEDAPYQTKEDDASVGCYLGELKAGPKVIPLKRQTGEK
jgi:hypothetical protein